MRLAMKVATVTGSILLPALATGAQTVLYVDDDAPPNGDGQSWDTAYRFVQDALDAAGNLRGTTVEIRVGQGFYAPDDGAGQTPGDPNATFQLLDNVALRGGHAGYGAVDPDARDVEAFQTTLSGDVNQDDVYGDPVWYIGWDIVTANSVHVVNGSGVGATAELDGFTVIAGYASSNSGGGLYVMGGSPTITDCTFLRNLASFAHGGGVYIGDGSPVFERCTFHQNWVHLGHGGGVFLYGASGALFADCSFSQNRSVGTIPEGAGGGLAHLSDSAVTVRRCMFRENIAENFYGSGGDAGGYGGGLYHFGPGGLVVSHSSFLNNRSNAGGGFFSWRDASVVNCLFRGNQAPEYQGHAGGWGGIGGGIAGSSFAGSLITVTGCTIVSNTAKRGAGIRVVNSADADVSSCILWANSDEFGSIGPAQIKGCGARYCCIENMLVGEPGEDPPDPEDFPNCIDADPSFIDLDGGDLHLASGSPCIDAADNTAFPPGLETDLDGAPRFVDDPNIDDTGFGSPPIVDMGAFEYQTPGPLGDLDGDGSVNVFDLLALLGAWGPCPDPPATCPADLNGDDLVDVFDLLILLGNWG